MNIALILSGGTGSRFGADCPKQFLPLKGIPVLLRTIAAFDQNENIQKIAVVAAADEMEKTKELVKTAGFNTLICFAAGGETRQQSCKNGLNMLSADKDDIILIHDAARPLVTQKIIDENIAAASIYGAAVTAMPSADTAFLSDGEGMTAPLNRKEVYLAQTPQSFKFSIIFDAIQGDLQVTDDAALVFKLGYEIKIVKGDRTNIKITEPPDMTAAESFLNSLEE